MFDRAMLEGAIQYVHEIKRRLDGGSRYYWPSIGIAVVLHGSTLFIN